MMNLAQDGGINSDIMMRTDDDRGAQSSYISVYEALDSGIGSRVRCYKTAITPKVFA